MSDVPATRAFADLPSEVDVVVVGSGAAALAGAYTAAVRGLRVLVLEKTALLGGTSAYSGAGLWLPGNDVQRRGGVADSVEAGIEYLRATVGDRTPAALQDAYVRTAPELVAFLEQDPALEFETMTFPDYFEAPGRAKPAGRDICPVPLDAARLGDRLAQLRPTMGADKFDVDVPRDTLSNGQALIARLLLAIDATGNADIRTHSPLESLVQDDGRVVGVRTGGRQVDATVGVLVAAGGFECDTELRRRHQGLPTGDWTAASPGSNTGDALAAFEAVGAATDLLDEAWWCPATLFPTGRAVFTLGFTGGIIVGPDGKRFGNESLPYDRFGHLMLEQIHQKGPDAEFWWIFDSRTEEPPAIVAPPANREAFRAATLWRSGDTPEELANEIGVPAAALRDTVQRFNGFAASGTDADFHRGEDDYDLFFAIGDGQNPALVPLDRGPLHAVRMVLGDLGTKGGARTDTSGQVLDTGGRPIPGLYAAGGSMASVTGHVYPGPGTPLGAGMVFGYRAATAMWLASQGSAHAAES